MEARILLKEGKLEQARDMFDIKPGDTLLLMADESRGIALVENSGVLNFAKSVFEAQEEET